MRKLPHWIPVLSLASLATCAVLLVALAFRTGAQAAQPPAQAVTPGAQGAQASSSSPLTIVIDPAHGGADLGARGPSGVNEKDLVLTLARALRIQLVQQGRRTIMTRDGDTDPTYDDRAAIANGLPETIFISLHVSSTGPDGTVRAYYYQFSAPFTYSPTIQSSGEVPPAAQVTPAPGGLIPWREAQRPFVDVSQRLASLVQAQVAGQFSGSPAKPIAIAVRDLRSIAAPAVAVEVSSVSVPNPAAVANMAAPLSAAIAKAVSDFLPAPPPLPATPGMPPSTAPGGEETR